MTDFLNGIAMVGGDGTQSYANNSILQREVAEACKLVIRKSIDDLVQPKHLDTFCIADLGCSVGSNTFIAMDNIIESVKLKYLNADTIPEFHVYFNDHALNDFNTLFRSLSPKREYYVSGVPGSFYVRQFPRASLRIVHSSFSLHWLSQVPKEILDPNSPAYNKGRIQYMGDNEEVFKAYSRQHSKDFSSFLHARAQEIVPRGLLTLVIPGCPDNVHYSLDAFVILNDLMGECLMDLAKQGVIDEEMVDTFNLPEYFASPREIEEIVKRDGHFDIERIESLPEVNASYCRADPKDVSHSMRAVMAGLIEEHFGRPEIIADVFRILAEKVMVKAADEEPGVEFMNLFVLLKRKE